MRVLSLLIITSISIVPSHISEHSCYLLCTSSPCGLCLILLLPFDGWQNWAQVGWKVLSDFYFLFFLLWVLLTGKWVRLVQIYVSQLGVMVLFGDFYALLSWKAKQKISLAKIIPEASRGLKYFWADLPKITNCYSVIRKIPLWTCSRVAG